MIPYGKQDIQNADVDAVLKVLKSDFLTQGPVVPKFEDSVKKQSDYQPILSIIKSLIIAEYEAKDEGTENGSRIRINFNRFLNNL